MLHYTSPSEAWACSTAHSRDQLCIELRDYDALRVVESLLGMIYWARCLQTYATEAKSAVATARRVKLSAVLCVAACPLSDLTS